VGTQYWNIKRSGAASRDLAGKSCEVTLLRDGGFFAIAPQMRHREKQED